MLGGTIDLSDLPLDRPLPESLLPEVDSINRRRGRVEVFRRYAQRGLTLRELIIQAQETGHWSVAGTPEQLADAIEERFRAGVLDVISLHAPRQPGSGGSAAEQPASGAAHKRSLLDTDYPGDDFRSNLDLPRPSVRAAPKPAQIGPTGLK